MITLMNINTPLYPLAIDNTSKSIAFSESDAGTTSIIVNNDSTNPCFVVMGRGAAPTAVFPTTTIVTGKLIPAKTIISFTKNAGDNFLSAVQATAGVGSLYVSLGAGS